MKINSNSNILKNGIPLSVYVTWPDTMDIGAIERNIIVKAVDNFNKKLDERGSVTEKINEFSVDILGLKYNKTHCQLYMISLQPESTFENLMWKFTGQIIFKENSEKNIEQIIITNIIYKNTEGKEYNLLNNT